MKIRTSFVAAVVATGAYLLATPAQAQFTASQSRPFRRQPERPSVAEVKESGGRGG